MAEYRVKRFVSLLIAYACHIIHYLTSVIKCGFVIYFSILLHSVHNLGFTTFLSLLLCL